MTFWVRAPEAITTFALTGFANLASLAILLGRLGRNRPNAAVPYRKIRLMGRSGGPSAIDERDDSGVIYRWLSLAGR